MHNCCSFFYDAIDALWYKLNMQNLQSLRQISDPNTLNSDHLRALWYDLNDDWDSAHSIVQARSDLNAMWIHAYLHRKEGDLGNSLAQRRPVLDLIMEPVVI